MHYCCLLLCSYQVPVSRQMAEACYVRDEGDYRYIGCLGLIGLHGGGFRCFFVTVPRTGSRFLVTVPRARAVEQKTRSFLALDFHALPEARACGIGINSTCSMCDQDVTLIFDVTPSHQPIFS